MVLYRLDTLKLIKNRHRTGSIRKFCNFKVAATDQIIDDNVSIASSSQSAVEEQPPLQQEKTFRIRAQRFTYAMLMCYNGRKYYGMQVQNVRNPPAIPLPTIERSLLDALLCLRLIDDEDRTNLPLFKFQRASRTDKGVSAAKQICSLQLPLGRVPEKFADEDGEFALTPSSALAPLNALLPEDIRVIAIKRVTKQFDAKRYCDSRYYTYTMPTYALDAAEQQIDPLSYRIPKDHLQLANQVLTMYRGMHNFYNFTKGRPPTDKSCIRMVVLCEAGEPFVRNGVEFVTIHVLGNSFMMHQIRKMLGLWIGIMRGHVDQAIVQACWEPSRVHVPLAPPLGLVLTDIYYHGYFRRYKQSHEAVVWDEYEEKLRDFRERHIDSVIFDAEINGESPMPHWLELLKDHDYFEQRNTSSEPVPVSASDPESDPDRKGDNIEETKEASSVER